MFSLAWVLGVTHAQTSVLSAAGSLAMAGASRWLEANALGAMVEATSAARAPVSTCLLDMEVLLSSLGKDVHGARAVRPAIGPCVDVGVSGAVEPGALDELVDALVEDRLRVVLKHDPDD